MSFQMECKKGRRTGLFPTFICGAIFAAAVPVVHMTVRFEMYLGLDAPPLKTLLDANWKMMALLHTLLIVLGACMLYHVEYSDNAMQRMRTLPVREGKMFFGKLLLLAGMCLLMLTVETAAIAFCCKVWFETPTDLAASLLKHLGFTFLLLLPAVFQSLLVASLCKNMWISLGIGVICIFMAAMLPADRNAISLFPFALPYQTLLDPMAPASCGVVLAAVIQIVVFSIVLFFIPKVRRRFE